MAALVSWGRAGRYRRPARLDSDAARVLVFLSRTRPLPQSIATLIRQHIVQIQ